MKSNVKQIKEALRNSCVDSLIEVFESVEFQEELQELSSYGSNIKQERPIMYLLAKFLRRKDLIVILEKNKTDIVIQGVIRELKLGKKKVSPTFPVSIEAKFFFEFDLKKDAKKFKWNKDEIEAFITNNQKSSGWSPVELILEDIFVKKPDIFILIIQSRDLTSVRTTSQLDRIVCSDQTLNYNKKFGINNKSNFQILQDFLHANMTLKPFKLNELKLKIVQIFPSTYHIYLLNFIT